MTKAEHDEKLVPPHPRWRPENGEMYFCLTTRGYLSKEKWFDTARYEDVYKFGNLFLSAEDATFAAERQMVLNEMREWAGNSYDGVYIYYHRPFDKIMIDRDIDSNYYCHGDIRFISVDDAKNCIKAVGEDRIKKYYFMIPEDEA